MHPTCSYMWEPCVYHMLNLQLSLQITCTFREQLLHTHTHTCLTCIHIHMLLCKAGKKHLINMYTVYHIVQISGRKNFREFGETECHLPIFYPANCKFQILQNSYIYVKCLNYCKFAKTFLAHTLKWLIFPSFTPPEFRTIRYLAMYIRIIIQNYVFIINFCHSFFTITNTNWHVQQ